jgi:serine protease Do
MNRVCPWLMMAVFALAACDRSEQSIEAAPVRAQAPQPQQPQPQSQAKADVTTKPAPVTEFRHQFVAAAKAISPAVVSITSTSTAQRSRMEGFPFDLFGGGPGGGEGPVRRGIGSGVVIDTNGHILTNNHVVANADEVRVVMPGKQEVTAKLVGTDPKTDLAVVKIDPSKVKLRAAVLGESDKLQVGEWVIACGSPFGLSQTVSAGIISAVGRGDVGITEYEDFIQTDAAINPGNSGGPLVDLDGRVVGINTAIASQSGSNAGVGFAIPIAMARVVLDQLVKTGKVVRGYVGLLIADVNEDLAQSFSYKGEGGVLVQDVTPRGPAARAGIKPGDIVFERDGKPVSNAAAFRNAIADTAPGTAARFKVWRDGKPVEVSVTLGELPGSGEVAARRDEEPAAHEKARWGVSLADLTPELATRLELSSSEGALVQQVANGSPAEQAGLQPGDVIVSVGDKPTPSAAQARALLMKSDGPVRLRVQRSGGGRFVILPKRN